MNKVLKGYLLALAMSMGASVMASTPISAETEKILSTLDTPVYIFETTSKDPFSLEYHPAAATLESVQFGIYDGKGAHVKRIKNMSTELKHLFAMRWTTLCEFGMVKMDEKGNGWRESLIARSYEDFFKAIGVMPEHYYKKNPFVDQYAQNMPMKWVFNNASELTSLREYLEPRFAEAKFLEKGLQKPVLVVECVSKKLDFTAQDYEFLNTYFTMVDTTNETVKSFYTNHQKHVLKAFLKVKDMKHVKEAFADMVFRYVESMTNEFKGKEMGVAIITAAISAVTFELIKEAVKDITKHAHGEVKKHAHKRVIEPLFGKAEKPAKEADDSLDGAIAALQEVRENRKKAPRAHAHVPVVESKGFSTGEVVLMAAGALGVVVVGCAVGSAATD